MVLMDERGDVLDARLGAKALATSARYIVTSTKFNIVTNILMLNLVFTQK